MSVPRYNTSRSKSRSPAPHSGFRSPPSRPFLPPSHYAAAAGIPYPNDQMSSTDYGDSRETILPSTSSSVSPNPSSQTPFKAVSYASQLSHLDDSSFDSNAALSSRQSNLVRRQSRLGDLPMLEAQLLPSLRDTIDRMTKPSRTSVVETSARSPFLEPPDRSGNLASVSSSSSSASGSSVCRPTTSQSIFSPALYSTPKPDWVPRSVPSTPSEQSIPQPKLKSALKSALRPLTPKLSANYATMPNTPSPSPGGPLRTTKTSLGTGKKTQALPAPSTMVADIKRGAGMASYGRSPSPNVRPEEPPVIQTGRARSRTDPGTVIKTPAAFAHSAVTPQPNLLYASRLPRRNERPRLQRLETDLEIGHGFDTEDKGKWKLVVANAVVVPSSSSENERDPRTPEKASRLPKPKNRYTHGQAPGQARGETPSRFGLGFGFGDYGAKLRGIFLDSTNRIVSSEEEPSSVYAEDGSTSRETNATSSSMGSTSDWQSQELAHDQRDDSPLEVHSYDEEPPDMYRKRREALLGIVQGLDQVSKSRLSRNSSVYDDCEYNGQEGLAISGSEDFDAIEPMDIGYFGNGDRRSSQYRSEETAEVGGQDYRRSSSENRRSNTTTRSPLPTFKISTEDDDRKQSVDRFRALSSPTPDRERLSHSTANSSGKGRADTFQLESTREDRGQHDARDGGAFEGKRLQSRSPIIRNEEAETPATLQTRPVYQGQQVTSPILSGQRYRRKEDCGKHSNMLQQTKPTRNNVSSDISSSTESSYAAATRQREAFGIPRPISDYYSDSMHEVEALSHADSDLSSVGDNLWREDCEGFSAGAETLFEKLGGGSHHANSARGRRSSTKSNQGQLRCDDRDFPRQRSHSSLSQNSDAPSVYDDQFIEPSQLEKDQVTTSFKGGGTWRSSIPPSVYSTLLEQHGEVEMQRQEVIWELWETEDVFVKHLHAVVRLFVQPLRARNSKTWITGVPPDVAHLFDWLEDIVNLHSQILATLQAARKGQYSVVERIAMSLKVFVSRFEVYQPYLVRLEDIAALIERLMDDEHSDFGEFVTLQEGSAECDEWSLEKFLIEPVNRLAQYPEFFRRLLGVTPSNHPDYLPTFSLLHCMNTIIRVMSEVKFREDEYDIVKDISTRIHGLPSSAQLARRERRLLAQGTLLRLQSAHHLLNFASSPDAVPKRNSKLITAINDWDVQQDRSGSVKSSSTTTMSFRSYDTASSCSSESRFNFHRAISSPLHLGRDMPYAGFQTPPSAPDRPRPPQSLKRLPDAAHPTVVNAFVFSDLVVFAAPIARRESNKCQNWRLLEDIGIARVLSVTEGPDADTRDSFVLDLLPMSESELETGVLENNPAVVPLYLSVPADAASGSSSASSHKTKTNWLSMFRQCSQFTLRSLSFLSHPGGRLDHGLEVDLELDTHQSVLAILASGLPLPKSPSVQLEEVALGESGSARQQEREERGWWSLRFQQVLREMQRRDALSVSAGERPMAETS